MLTIAVLLGAELHPSSIADGEQGYETRSVSSEARERDSQAYLTGRKVAKLQKTAARGRGSQSIAGRPAERVWRSITMSNSP